MESNDTAVLAETTDVCLFLRRLPLEIRIMVYEELLYRPNLSHYNLQEYNWERRCWTSCQLSPAILRTCRQIYVEASVILYESNTFATICMEKEGYLPETPFNISCPLTRHHSNKPLGKPISPSSALTDILAIPGFRKVRSWKMIITRHATGPFPISLLSFCQAIAITTPVSIEIGFVSWESYRWLNWTSRIGNMSHSLQDVLAPFRLVRGVQKVNIIHFSGLANKPVIQYGDACLLLHKEYKSSMESLQPYENGVQKYLKLAHFVRVMERAETFRFETATAIQKHSQSHKGQLAATAQDFYATTGEWSSISALLKIARAVTLSKDDTQFKICRDIVLEKLEAYYHHLVVICVFLAQMSIEWGGPKGHVGQLSFSSSAPFSPHPGSWSSKFTSRLVIWERQPPGSARAGYWEIFLIVLFSNTLKNDNIMQASTTLERSLYFADWEVLTKLFVTIRKDFACLVQQVQQTGKALFDYDIDTTGSDRGCVTSIGLEETFVPSRRYGLPYGKLY